MTIEPILVAQGLTQIFGPGCDQCLGATGPQASRSVCPHCGSIVALQDFSVDIFSGECLGILGESGAGKSALLNILDFSEVPHQGGLTYYADGSPVDALRMNERQQQLFRNQAIGRVHQNPRLALNYNISVGANIAERLLMFGEQSYRRIRDIIRRLFDRLEIPISRMDDKPASFSGGMQQRVQIAKALSVNPPVLLLDEMTTGLDLSVQAALLDLILQLKEEYHMAIVVVTHDLGVIRHLTSQVMVLHHGRVVETGLTDRVLEDPQDAFTQKLIASEL